MNYYKSDSKGFTLLEVLVAIVIQAVIVILGVYFFSPVGSQALGENCAAKLQNNFNQMSTAIDAYSTYTKTDPFPISRARWTPVTYTYHVADTYAQGWINRLIEPNYLKPINIKIPKECRRKSLPDSTNAYWVLVTNEEVGGTIVPNPYNAAAAHWITNDKVFYTRDVTFETCKAFHKKHTGEDEPKLIDANNFPSPDEYSSGKHLDTNSKGWCEYSVSGDDKLTHLYYIHSIE